MKATRITNLGISGSSPYSKRALAPALVLLGLIAALVTACSGPAGQEATSSSGQAVLDDPVETAGTAWWWYTGQSGSQISAILARDNARLVSLRVTSTNPLLFDVALVQNTGTYAKEWWWYPSETAQGLASLATANNARIVSLEPYVVNGTTLFAAIMIHNTGADARAWWWYYDQTPAKISALLQSNNARLVDLREYDNGLYGAVMVSNASESQGWWWYVGVSASQVSSFLATNHAYLVSLDPNANGTFNVVMNSFQPGHSWWWYYAQTPANVATLLAETNSRIYDLKSYVVAGTRYYDVLLTDNGPTPALPQFYDVGYYPNGNLSFACGVFPSDTSVTVTISQGSLHEQLIGPNSNGTYPATNGIIGDTSGRDFLRCSPYSTPGTVNMTLTAVGVQSGEVATTTVAVSGCTLGGEQ